MGSIQNIFQRQKLFFSSGETRSLAFRLKMLNQLDALLRENEELLTGALYKDLRKPEQEAWMSEIALTLGEIAFVKKNLRQWMRPQCVRTSLALFPSRARIYHEPLGVVLIIGPWNFPLQLVLAPLVGAIAAGNCAVLKPSELTPHTSQVISELIAKYFAPEFVACLQGGVELTTELLQYKFDHIFFTGSTPVGKIIMSAAAKNLVPVTLELGGKSPTIVDETADLDLAARRIIWGKVFNAGQVCVAPDYVYVHKSVEAELLAKLKQQIGEQLSKDPQKSNSYGRIVNLRNLQRLQKMLTSAKVFYGGAVDEKDLYIQPTLLTDVTWNDPVMQEEIFGPILPVLAFASLDEVFATVKSQPKPLSAYLFSRDHHNQNKFLQELSFGGGCINDVIVHQSSHHFAFGGVGDSGMGGYHGFASFRTFSHSKSVLKRGGFLDLSARYAPYSPRKWRLLRWLF